jgi:hypothetical protein
MSKKPTISTVIALANTGPLMSHNWSIESVTLQDSTNANSFNSFFPSRFFQNYVESIELPFRQFNADDRHLATTKQFYAGFNTVNNFTVTFFEDSNASTIKGFSKWQDLIMDSDPSKPETFGNYYPASNYKAKVIVNLLSDTIQGKIIRTASLLGVFPLIINPLNMTSVVDIVTVQVTFSVDKVNWSNI